MPGSIKSLVVALDRCTDFSIENLELIMREHLPEEKEVLDISSATLPYGRTLIKATDRYELIIGAWPRNGWCDPHDHGEAIGVVHGYSGEIEHFRYEMNGASLCLVEQSRLHKGATARLDHRMIHSLQNVSSDEPYVGLHLYAPPTSNVRVFDVRNGDVYYVTDESAALIPRDERFIVRKETKAFAYRNLVRANETVA